MLLPRVRDSVEVCLRRPPSPPQRFLWPISRRRRANIHYIEHSHAGQNPNSVGKGPFKPHS